MRERVVYMGGHWVPELQAKVSIYDLSVAQGAAAFEMTRSFGAGHFKLREHLLRLERSCRALAIPLAYTVDELEALCHDVTVRNLDAFAPGDEHRLMIVASPGCPAMYSSLGGTVYGPWVYIADFPLRYTVAGLGKYFDTGVNLWSAERRQVNSSAIPATAKHRSRAHFHAAQTEVAPDWALLLDERGYVTEGPGFNVLWRSGERVGYRTTGVLNGISQAHVVEMVHAWGYDTVACEGRLGDLQTADEVWVTATPFCILPVGCVEGGVIGTGQPGPVYQKILETWSRQVGVDIKQQIQSWEGQRPCAASELCSVR